jgi:hypothetical protein
LVSRRDAISGKPSDALGECIHEQARRPVASSQQHS